MLHTIARGNDVDVQIIEALLEAGEDADLSSDNGITHLYLAVNRGSLEVARALLKSGNNVNARSMEGRVSTTPRMPLG